MPRLRLFRAPTGRLCGAPGLWVLPTARRLLWRDHWIWLLPKSQIRVQAETLASEPALAMDDWPCGRDDAIRADVTLTKLLAGEPSGASTTAKWLRVRRGEH